MNVTDFSPFNIARLPRILFGQGQFSALADLIAGFGHNVLLVTGARSLQATSAWQQLQTRLAEKQIRWQQCHIAEEPSPTLIDALVEEHAQNDYALVVGIGGGSVLDAAKAIAGLLKVKRSVMDYLEGVGPELAYSGPAVPFIAVPTTAGTGSEATKNAVLSIQGEQGFKKSFRDDMLVAEYALVDPDLLSSCPAQLIAANGMDALTQLIESYVSSKANVLTDALAISGLRAARDSLLDWYLQRGDLPAHRTKMAYAAMISGITLAQVGLGSVHGLASPLGAFYPIPHGVVCGTLVAAATKMNIEAMLNRDTDNIALDKYARLGEVLSQKRHGSRENAWQALIELLEDWTQQMQLPLLNTYGVAAAGLAHVVAHSRGSSMKTNPIVLTDSELASVLQQRLG